MAKEVQAKIKLQCPGGQATPAPPVGPALGQHGVNIGEFVKRFNDATRKDMGTIYPVIVSVYKDRTFDFIIKSPPASALLKKAAGCVKGAAVPNKETVGKVTWQQCRDIAKAKLADINTNDLEMGARMVAGTARSMGIKVEGK
jgi:large subunit ribosomal protein L11